MDNVFLKSGEKPRYFNFGTISSPVTTTTANGNSRATYKESPHASFQAIITGANSATVGATVTIQVSNQDESAAETSSNWIPMGTITLSGTINTSSITTSSFTDGFNSTSSPWRWVRAVVSSISGTGATVSVIMGV